MWDEDGAFAFQLSVGSRVSFEQSNGTSQQIYFEEVAKLRSRNGQGVNQFTILTCAKWIDFGRTKRPNHRQIFVDTARRGPAVSSVLLYRLPKLKSSNGHKAAILRSRWEFNIQGKAAKGGSSCTYRIPPSFGSPVRDVEPQTRRPPKKYPTNSRFAARPAMRAWVPVGVLPQHRIRSTLGAGQSPPDGSLSGNLPEPCSNLFVMTVRTTTVAIKERREFGFTLCGI